jgi:hypothetical protein
MKIRRMEDKFFDADRKTDMTNLTIAYRKLTKAPKRDNK